MGNLFGSPPLKKLAVRVVWKGIVPVCWLAKTWQEGVVNEGGGVGKGVGNGVGNGVGKIGTGTKMGEPGGGVTSTEVVATHSAGKDEPVW